MALCAKPCVRKCSRGERESLFYTTCSYEKQYRINECNCAARVTAQNIYFTPRVVPSVQQYIRCTLFTSIMHQALSFCPLGIPCPFSSQISRPSWLSAPWPLSSVAGPVLGTRVFKSKEPIGSRVNEVKNQICTHPPHHSSSAQPYY